MIMNNNRIYSNVKRVRLATKRDEIDTLTSGLGYAVTWSRYDVIARD